MARLRVLGVVPARGGSKGIPRKNLRPLAGRPLLAFTAETALRAERLDRVVLTTDDEEIAGVGRRLGLDVPFLRPPELARDDTPTLPVVRHAVGWLEERGERYDAVCLLQPTSPLRSPADVDACVRLLEETGADSVVSVLPVPDEHNPHWVWFLAEDGTLASCLGARDPLPRRQDLPPAFHRDGSVYVTRRDVVMERDSLYGDRIVPYPMDPDRSANLDEPEEWRRLEARLEAAP